jgi:AcrR family transcriptional regulator
MAADRSYRMTARAEATRATAARIADAAIETFWEQPTDRLSLNDVARRAGVTKQTVLRHYESRAGLLAAAAERALEQVGEERSGVTPGDVDEAVRVLVEHYERVGDAVIRMLAEEVRNPALTPIADRGRGYHAAWCEEVLAPALDMLDPAERRLRLAQVIAATDVQTWKLLRRDRGLGRPETERAMAGLLRPLAPGRGQSLQRHAVKESP